MSEFEYLDGLFDLLRDRAVGERVVGRWRFKRVGQLHGMNVTGVIYDPLGPEGAYVELRPGGTPVYLVFDRGVPVAAVAYYGDTAPVELGRYGERVVTPSGVAVLHADPSRSWIEPGLPLVRRAWAVLDGAARENLRERLERAGVDPRSWPVEPREGDFAEGWLLLEGEQGSALGILVDPWGSSVLECLDAERRPVASLLYWGD
jgi:hypothetical protein